ncbi:MAG: MotA/TolQ/ExbB proton channel family protein [Thiovulaceae bacterium]|nr:MotA/TolQ/ExbB proton channel family protein [Sulfurimonadaceae bacterium]
MDISTLSDAFFEFMTKGGSVLWAIFFVSLLSAFVFMQSLINLFINAPILQKKLLNDFVSNPNNYNRQRLQRHARQEYYYGFTILKFFIALLPLFGLLGTVTGMIDVFDVMSHFGNSNPRLMAAGVAKAIIPTMTGMALAVLGLIFYHLLFNLAQKRTGQLTHAFNGVTQ